MVVRELVPVELVVDAVQRRLHQRRRARVAQYRDHQVRRTIPALAAVQIGQVVVERHRRGHDALLAFGVERVEVVGEPVADAAVFGDASGHQREMTSVRLVVVALRAVDHEREDGASGPIGQRAIPLPQRGGAVRDFARRRCGISRISARRLAPGVSAAGSAREGGGRPPSLKSSGQNVRATKVAGRRRTAHGHRARRQECDRRCVEVRTIERDLRRGLVRNRGIARDERAPIRGHSRVPNDGGRRDPDERRVIERRVRRPRCRPLTDVVERADAGRERRHRQVRFRQRDRLGAEIPERLADRRTVAVRSRRDPEIGRGVKAEHAGRVGGRGGSHGKRQRCGQDAGGQCPAPGRTLRAPTTINR